MENRIEQFIRTVDDYLGKADVVRHYTRLLDKLKRKRREHESLQMPRCTMAGTWRRRVPPC